MQIFVVNTEGKTVTVDVEPWNSIKTVKDRLQVKIGIPTHLQRLVFNSKLLMDEESLLHYNIQKESNIRLNIQTWYSSAADPENVPAHSVDWSKVAISAKNKVDKEVEEKKGRYEELLTRKSEVLAETREVKAEINQSLAVTEEAGRMVAIKEKSIIVTEKYIEKLNDDLKRANEAIKESKRDILNLNSRIEDESRKRTAKREELGELRVKIMKFEKEMEETFLVASDRLQKEKEELIKSNTIKDHSMREFLKETIVEKETWLNCPVCLLTASPPIYKCTEDHLICSKCFPRVNNKCPTCRTEFTKKPAIFRLAEENWRVLQKLKGKLREF